MSAGSDGQIYGVSIDSFLQMAQMERTTCTLTVKFEGQVGYLYILDGELISAETGDFEKVEAACRIISWPESTIEIENSCNKTENEINQPLMNILMEGLRLRDNTLLAAKDRTRADQTGVAETAKTTPPPAPEDIHAEAVPDEFSLDDFDLELSEEPVEEFSIELSEAPPADSQAEVLPDELSFEDLEIKPSEDLSLELSLEPSEDLSLELSPEPSKAPPIEPSPEPPLEPTFEPPEDLMEKIEKLEKREITADRYVPIKEKPKIDPRQKLKRKRIMVFSALGVLTVIVAISSVVSMRAVKAKQAEEAYQRVLTAVENQETLEEKLTVLQNYIDSHKESPFVEHAENKVKEVRKIFENREFQELIRTVDALPLDDNFEKEARDAYNQHLEKYPDGSRTADVRERISRIPNIVDNIDYDKLQKVAESGVDERITAYNLYLLNHPKGKHRKSVEELISNLSEAYYDDLREEIRVCDSQQKWEKCIRMCEYFVSTFKDHQRWDEMGVVKNEMQAKSDLADLKERAKQEVADHDYEAAKQVYLTYLEKNPDSHAEGKISEELAKLDEALARKDEWEKVAEICRNRNYTVYDRKRAVKGYIANNPSGPFTQDAKMFLRQLETEKQPVAGYSEKGTGKSLQQSGSQTVVGYAKVDTQKIQRERENVRAQLKSVDRFVANGDGTFTDSMTGLMWCVLDSGIELGRCIDYKSAVEYVKGLTTGGYRDWRMPTSSDLAALYKSKPFFPGSGSPWYWTAKTFVDGYHVKSGIVTSKQETVFKREYADVEDCGAVRAVRP
ncbi:MAG: DUF4388 domain-containing protein [Pseudomonadota bacterium]